MKKSRFFMVAAAGLLTTTSAQGGLSEADGASKIAIEASSVVAEGFSTGEVETILAKTLIENLPGTKVAAADITAPIGSTANPLAMGAEIAAKALASGMSPTEVKTLVAEALARMGVSAEETILAAEIIVDSLVSGATQEQAISEATVTISTAAGGAGPAGGGAVIY